MRNRTVGFHVILNMEYIAPDGARKSALFDGTVDIQRGAPAQEIFKSVMKHIADNVGYTIPMEGAAIHAYIVTPNSITAPR